MKTYDELLAECDSLAAQVESCNDALKALLKSLPWIGGSLQADGQFYYKVAESVFKKAESALAKTPKQHLAEIRAESGRAGFVAGLELADSPIRGMLSKNDLLCRADEYAAKVRQGGDQ